MEKNMFARGIDTLEDDLGREVDLTAYTDEERGILSRMFDYMRRELEQGKEMSIDQPDEDAHLALFTAFNQAYVERQISDQQFIELVGETQSLESEILYDKLTGLANRRSFVMEAERQARICERSPGATYSMCVFDIDHFGRLNDTLSHKHGDAVLIALSRLFKKALPRKSDLTCRYGGEEFVVILGNTGLDDAALVAEKVRALIEDQLLAEANQVIAEFNMNLPASEQVESISRDIIPRITVSAGVAEFDPSSDYKKTFTRADQALNCAKSGKPGEAPEAVRRNRVVPWQAELGEAADNAEIARELQSAEFNSVSDASLTRLSREEIIAQYEADVAAVADDGQSLDAVRNIKKMLLANKERITDEKIWKIIHTNLEKLTNNYTCDQLTGVANRAEYERRLERELSTAERCNQPLSMLVMDVDLFSSVNDIYGHDAGDAVLKALGMLLREISRKSDLACRMGAGSEEFTIIMPNTDQQGAVATAERIRQYIADNLIVKYNELRAEHDLLGEQFDIQRDRSLSVTIGVTTIQPQPQTIKRDGQDVVIHRFPEGAATTIFTAADHALIRAKEATPDGRSRGQDKQALKDPRVSVLDKKQIIQNLLRDTRNCVAVNKGNEITFLRRGEAAEQ